MKQKNNLLYHNAEILLLEKKIKKSELKFEILKNAGPCIIQGKYEIFDFILKNEFQYSIRLMTEVLSVDRREYHRWKINPLNETKKKKILMHNEITAVFWAFQKRYGSERIAVVLQHSGHKLSGRTVRKYMSEMGLSAKGKNK